MKLKPYLLVMALMMSATLLHAVTPKLISGTNAVQRDKWVDSVYNSLTPRQRIEQLFVPKVNPANIATAKQTIYKYVKTYGAGGLLFSKGTIEQYAQLTDYAQSLADVPLLMTLDGEWGPAMRVTGTTKFPYNMTLGAISDPDLLYAYGREVARECKLLGIQVNFAPVLDVNSNPDNPVIGFRSFGEDPARVSTLANAFSRGLEDGGIMAVGKHFPGHGDTNVDSHKALPTVTHSLNKLKTTDLYPFQQFISEGHSGIMVGHLNVPALDDSGAPASLSQAITGNLLKKQMGFEGLVWTDGLAMKGAVKAGVNNCVAALQAGADVLLEPASFVSDLDAVVAAVKSGALSESLIEKRCKKILAYKYALGLSVKPAPVTASTLKDELNAPSAGAINRRLTAASVICLKNSASLLPVHDLNHNDIAIVNIGESKDNTFSRICAKYAEITSYGTTAALTDVQLSAIRKHDLVIAAIYSDNATAIANLRQLQSVCPDLITVFLLNPYKLTKFAPINSKAILLVGENTRLTQEYCAQAVFGGIRINGSLPVKVQGVADEGTCVGIMKTRLGYTSPEVVGLNPNITDKIDSLVRIGLNTGAFPGCQVLVAKDGEVVVSKSYGYTDSSKKQRVNDSTLYDLASVTKVTGTLPGLMLNYNNKKLDLHANISKYLTTLKDTDKSNITVTDLLLHESGLPETIDIRKLMMDTATYSGRLIAYKRGGNHTTKIAKGVYANSNAQLRTDLTSATPDDTFDIAVAKGIYVGEPTIDTIMNRIYAVPVSDNKSYKYSDLNFILLKRIEEKLTGQNHETFIIDSIYAPLGAWHTSFRPLKEKSTSRVAATENDQFLRRQTIKGYVHDELAAFLGGAEGNAGLFSTAEDLAKLGQTWLNGGTYGGYRFYSPSTVKKFTTTGSKTSRRKLGFDAADTANPSKSPLPPQASAQAYGHIGFTGTCIWIDPAENLVYVFLSNRINPSRDNAAFSKLNIRPAILEEVYKAIK